MKLILKYPLFKIEISFLSTVKKYFFIIIIFLQLIPACAKTQIIFDDNFENGRLDTAYLHSAAFSLWPVSNLHFRITNAVNQNPRFKIFDSAGYQLRSYHRMLYRYAGESQWNFFDTAYKATGFDYYYFNNRTAFTKDTVYIAYWFPYTYSDLQKYIAGITGNKYLIQAGSKGLSYQGRNLYGYQITDTTYAECYKANVVITARQHPVESINGYFIEGLTNYLLFSTDSMANFLRRNFHFYIYPMLNPDGVFNGSAQNALGQGLNREWEDSLRISGTPEIDTIRPVIWHETRKKVNWSIDIHSNPGSNIPYYWWGYTGSASVPQWQKIKALQYVQSVALQDASSPIGTSSYQNYIQGDGVNSTYTAANWFRKSFAGIAFTFEPTSEPMGPSGNNAFIINNLKAAGSSLAKGFYNVFDTVQALGGSIDSVNNSFIAKISGGYQPYSYTWTGPVNGNSDTLRNLLTGLYTLTVIDSLGCTWLKQINYISTGFSQPNTNEIGIDVYPNPSNGLITIKCDRSIPSARVEIYDLLGRVFFTKDISLTSIIQLRLPAEITGTCFLKLTIDDVVMVKKIIIIH